MKPTKFFISILWLVTFSFASCSSSDDGPTPDNTTIYVAGAELLPGNAAQSATVWANGVATRLTTGVNYAAALSVFASGNDVYVGGYETNSLGLNVAKIWKNGVASILTDGTRQARVNDVFVENNTVYAVGTETDASFQPFPVLWVNGVKTQLSPNSGYARKIKVKNGVKYITGERRRTSTDQAKLWIVGTAINEVTLGDNDPSLSSTARGIDFIGDDYYVAGDQHVMIVGSARLVGRIWKNGILHYNLTDGTNNAQVFGMDCSATDAYTIGRDGAALLCWKNGSVHLTYTGVSDINGVSFANGNVYSCGVSATANAVMFTNGTISQLSSNPSSAIAIFVQ